MKKITLITLLIFNFTIIIAKNDSLNFYPKSFTYSNFLKSLKNLKEIDYKITQVVNADSLLKLEYEMNKEGKNMPEWYGLELKSDYNLLNSGTWDTLSNNDRIWRLRIICPLAKSLNVLFKNFKMTSNSYVFVYSSNKRFISDRYDSTFNTKNNILTSSAVNGNEFVIELYLPNGIVQDSLTISGLVYGYKDLFNNSSNKSNSLQSQSCEVDVNCNDGSDFCREKFSVALISLNLHGNLYAHCTGSLINNTNLDFKPYFLTAFHCIDTDLGGYIINSEIDVSNNWNIKFGYMKINCNGNYIEQTKEYAGTTFRSAWYDSDFALVELNQQPISGEYNFKDVYFNGWNKSENIPTNETSLHHPDGDYMKITKSSSSPGLCQRYTVGCVPQSGDNFWFVHLSLGVTEGGSSGSPLFDQNHRVIGQLFGGCSGCGLPDFMQNDKYGRFNKSWTGGGTNDTRLSNWLDPNNTGVSTLEGIKLPNLIYGISYDGSIPLNRNAYDQMKVGSDGLGPFNVSVGTTLNLKAGREIVIRPCSYTKWK